MTRRTDAEIEKKIKSLLVDIEVLANTPEYEESLKKHYDLAFQRMQCMFQAYATLMWTMNRKVPRHNSFLNPWENEK